MESQRDLHTSERKKEVIRQILRVFSRHDPGFTIEENTMVFSDRERALRVLRSNSMELLALNACDMENDIREVLLDDCYRVTIFQIKLLKELERITSLMALYNISFFVQKGFAMRRYYPVDCVRPMSDIDIVIHPDDAYRCKDAFTKAGYVLEDEHTAERQGARHAELHWISPHTNIMIECHWDLVNAKSMRRVTIFNPDFLFERVESYIVDGIEINVFPVTIDLAYLMTHHILHHQFKRVLWFADVLLIMMTENVDWEEFHNTVRRCNMERPVYYYLGAITNIVGREGLEQLMKLRNDLAPLSKRYYFFASFHQPESIFKTGTVTTRLRDHLFRNAFK